MKKILIITLSLSEKNGLGRYSLDLAKRLERYYQLVIFSGREETPQINLFNTQIRQNLPGLFEFFRLKNPLLALLYALMISWHGRKADAVHAFMDYPYSFVGALAASILRIPLFLTAHGTYSLQPFDKYPDRIFHQFALKKAKTIFCISHFTETALKTKIPVLRTRVINNGIDLEKFKWEPRPSAGKIILGVGALKPRKGYQVALEAIALVKKKYSDIEYYIVGKQNDKKYFDLLKETVHDLSLGDNIKFLNEVPDKELLALYNQASLFLLTPINIPGGGFEGFGLVYLEAGACSKPVIGSRGCGAEDAIIDGETGFLVEQNNPQAIAEAILKILANDSLSKRLGEAGRKRAQKMSWDNIAQKYLAIYKDFKL